MSNELRKNLPDDVVARLEALQKVEEVTEETQVEKNLPKMDLPIWFDGKQINEASGIKVDISTLQSG